MHHKETKPKPEQNQPREREEDMLGRLNERYGENWGRALFFVLVLTVIGFIVWTLRAYDPIHWFFYWWTLDPFGAALGFVLIGSVIYLILTMWDTYSFSSAGCVVGIVALLSVVALIFWYGLFFEAYRMTAMYEQTGYEVVEQPPLVTSMRAVNYAQAEYHFNNNVPDARFGVGDLDYVRDQWITEYGPQGWGNFLNSFTQPTQGYFTYDPEDTQPVQVVSDHMPYAEKGFWGNSLRVHINSQDPFSFYTEVLYVDDPSTGGTMAVISLLKTKGFMGAVPYVAKIVIIHQDESEEWLEPTVAQADPRLADLQLIPEYLERLRVEAYGWRLGFWPGIYREGRISVQRSTTNEENPAPYHFLTTDGYQWMTPMSPLGKQSFVGIASQQSNAVESPVRMFFLPEGEAYVGVDALVSAIKGAEGHPQGTNFIKVTGESAAVGVTDIMELMPIWRHDGLYFVGYATTTPPSQTRFFVIIDPETQVVYEDLYTIDEVNAWLNGEFELASQPIRVNETLDPAQMPEQDIRTLTDDELWNLLKRIIEELQLRSLD